MLPILTHPKRILFIASLVCLIPLKSHAVGISAYRIYLDKSTPNVSFRVYNKDVEAQDCALTLAHHNFDANSEIVASTHNTLPENSAKNWIRFSPKSFQLTPANAQTIRFSLRRKANTEKAEYRSYLVIDCGSTQKIGEEENDLISIKPKLIHNIPIIVRTGSLDAQLTIENIKDEGGFLTFTLERSGERSVYGDVELVHQGTDEVISSQTGLSIYAESERHALKLSKNNVDIEDISIRFTEDTQFGGNIVVETRALAK